MSQAIGSVGHAFTRVGIYVRLSDEDKNKKNKFDPSESIKNQIDLATGYAQQNGWLIVGIYCDDDYSGVTDDRPEFAKLISDCQAGKIDVVLCKNMSRFARNISVSEEYLETRFLEWGVRFIGLTDHTDNFDLGNKKSRQISGLTNQWYAEDASHNVRATFRTKREKGEFIGPFAVYGYKKSAQNKNNLLIDDEAARVVKLIFELYLQGNGTPKIAKILNDDKKIPNPCKYKEMKGIRYQNHFDQKKSGLWSKTSVKRILRNEVYIGNMVQHKKEKIHFKSNKNRSVPKSEWVVVKGTHEAIIDEATFYKVQKLLDSNIRSSGKGTPHLFAGKVKCKDCGHIMSKFSNSKQDYLGCSLYRLRRKECSSHTIVLNKLKEIVEKKVRSHIERTLQDRGKFVERLLASEEYLSAVDYLQQRIRKLTTQIESNKNGLKELYTDKSAGQIEEVLFYEIKDKFILERERLDKELAMLHDQLAEAQKESDRKEFWLNVLEKYANFLQLDRKLVNELIDFIEIGEKREDGTQEVIIYYNFAKVY